MLWAAFKFEVFSSLSVHVCVNQCMHVGVFDVVMCCLRYLLWASYLRDRELELLVTSTNPIFLYCSPPVN